MDGVPVPSAEGESLGAFGSDEEWEDEDLTRACAPDRYQQGPSLGRRRRVAVAGLSKQATQ